MCGICLIIGTIPYILFRQQVAFLEPVKEVLPREMALPDTALSRFVMFHFSDGMWYLGLLILMGALHTKQRGDNIIFAVAASMPFMLEAAQGLRLIEGTFDLLDLTTYLIILILYLLWQNLRRNKKEHSNAQHS